jgi:hypothetical protein
LEAYRKAVVGSKYSSSEEEAAAELAVLLVGDCKVAAEALKFSFICKEFWEVKGEDRGLEFAIDRGMGSMPMLDKKS